MSINRKLGFYARYPLMWVMLLWALTAPGQEERVYHFLVKETAEGAFNAALTSSKGLQESPHQQKRLQGCWDARDTRYTMLPAVQVVFAFLKEPAFLLSETKLPACPPGAIGANLLAQCFLVLLFPNAP